MNRLSLAWRALTDPNSITDYTKASVSGPVPTLKAGYLHLTQISEQAATMIEQSVIPGIKGAPWPKYVDVRYLVEIAQSVADVTRRDGHSAQYVARNLGGIWHEARKQGWLPPEE